jgi:hypothetical protein
VGLVDRILAVDPGTEVSAWVLLSSGTLAPVGFEIEENSALLSRLRDFDEKVRTACVVEKIESYGMPVGADIFETVFWSGRFREAWGVESTFYRTPRREVKLHLCNSPRATDATIRQALLDRFGGNRGAAQGTKKQPGPLYGVKADIWAALAIAVTFAETRLWGAGARLACSCERMVSVDTETGSR